MVGFHLKTIGWLLEYVEQSVKFPWWYAEVFSNGSGWISQIEQIYHFYGIPGCAAVQRKFENKIWDFWLKHAYHDGFSVTWLNGSKTGLICTHPNLWYLIKGTFSMISWIHATRYFPILWQNCHFGTLISYKYNCLWYDIRMCTLLRNVVYR